MPGIDETPPPAKDADIPASIARDAEVAAAVAAHEATADPHAGYLKESDYDANSLLVATTDNTPVPLVVGASTFVGRKSSGGITAMTPTEAKAELAIAEADVAGLVSDLAAKVPKSLFDANTILIATTDDTPVALTVGASTIVGRKSSGGIVALTGAEALAITGAATDSAVVHNTGTETVAGAKTFSSALTVSAGGLTVTGTSGSLGFSADGTTTTHSRAGTNYIQASNAVGTFDFGAGAGSGHLVIATTGIVTLSSGLRVSAGGLVVTGTSATFTIDADGITQRYSRAGTNYFAATHASGSFDFGGGGSSGHLVIANTGVVTFGQGIAIADTKGISFSLSTGSVIGLTTGQKFAFHAATPVAQRAGAAQAAVVTTSATQSSPWGFATQAQADALVTLVNELRAAVVEKGLIKGSA
jgi:hypothetical protein